VSFKDRFKKQPAEPEWDLTGMEPKYYEMDPDTETLLSSGLKLRDGHRVLIGDAKYRVDLDDIENAEDYYSARRLNRWCFVSEPETTGNLMSFVAIYDDYVQEKRTYNQGHSWIVKLDSLSSWSDVDGMQKPVEPLPIDGLPELKKWVEENVRGSSFLRPENITTKVEDSFYNPEYELDYIKDQGAWCNVIPLRYGNDPVYTAYVPNLNRMLNRKLKRGPSSPQS
jgi:hypothetical protein